MNFHGGDIYRFEGKLLDFSSNINPLGVPDSFKRMLAERMEDFTRYPDIEYLEVRKNIAKYLGMEDIDRIVPGNGAVELIYKLAATSGARQAFGLRPTFSEYGRAAVVNGIEYSSIPAFDKDFGYMDIDALLKNIRPHSLLTICNPNNPTGTFIEKSVLTELAEELFKLDCRLVVDETFIEFTDGYPHNSMVDLTGKLANLTVIRAATKFFGMPGIRLGYAITADKESADRLKETMEPWNINAAAVIAAGSIYEDQSYIDNTKLWITRERKYLFEELENIEGLKVFRSRANFHLLEIVGCKTTADELKSVMKEEGILIRTAEGFEGLSKSHFRLAVKDRASNDTLLRALRKCMKNLR